MADIRSHGPLSSLQKLAACRDHGALQNTLRHVKTLLDAASTRASQGALESEDAAWVSALSRTLTQLLDHFQQQQQQDIALICSLCLECLKYHGLLAGCGGQLAAALPLHYAFIRKLVSLQHYNPALHHGWELYRCLKEHIHAQTCPPSSASDVAIGTILNLVICSSEAGQCLPQQTMALNEAVSTLLQLLR